VEKVIEVKNMQRQAKCPDAISNLYRVGGFVGPFYFMAYQNENQEGKKVDFTHTVKDPKNIRYIYSTNGEEIEDGKEISFHLAPGCNHFMIARCEGSSYSSGSFSFSILVTK